MRIKRFAANIAIAVTLASSGPVYAGIPVIDVGNLQQSIMSTIESVAQTAKQIEQYKLQIQQYENMIRNTASPAVWIWDAAKETIGKLLAAQNMLSFYKNRLGSLDAYLAKYQNVAYYKTSPCFMPTGCSAAERAAMEQNRELSSESQKRANDALFRGIEQQETALSTDASNLQRLQIEAKTATGQMQALGVANQLASGLGNQMLQMRSMLMAQNQAETTRLQAVSDREAQQAAAAVMLRSGAYKASTKVAW